MHWPNKLLNYAPAQRTRRKSPTFAGAHFQFHATTGGHFALQQSRKTAPEQSARPDKPYPRRVATTRKAVNWKFFESYCKMVSQTELSHVREQGLFPVGCVRHIRTIRWKAYNIQRIYKKSIYYKLHIYIKSCIVVVPNLLIEKQSRQLVFNSSNHIVDWSMKQNYLECPSRDCL